jgi:hypothetical protein
MPREGIIAFRVGGIEAIAALGPAKNRKSDTPPEDL